MEQFNVWFLLLDHSERVHKLKLSQDLKKKKKVEKIITSFQKYIYCSYISIPITIFPHYFFFTLHFIAILLLIDSREMTCIESRKIVQDMLLFFQRS